MREFALRSIRNAKLLKKRRTPWKFVGFTDANIRGPNRLPVNGPGGAAVGIGS